MAAFVASVAGCAQLVGIEETKESPCYPDVCEDGEGSGGNASGGSNPGGGAEAGGGTQAGGAEASGGASGKGGSPNGAGGDSVGGGETGTGGDSSGGGAGGTGTGGDGTGGDGSGGDGTGGQEQRGPVLVEVDGFFIDATEVTNAQYEEFLTAKDGDTSGQPAECSFNDNYTPSEAWPNEPNLPVTYVDWCDARAFCDWAGKRLCGGINGSQLTDDNLTDESVSEWYLACAGPNPGDANNYPYGGTYDTVCNDLKYQQANSYPDHVEVGSLTDCEGHPEGVFDMVGNVTEWVDHCDGATGADDSCAFMGASVLADGSSAAHCENSSVGDSFSRSNATWVVGFRCCAD